MKQCKGDVEISTIDKDNEYTIKSEKLWTKSFLILWQSQFISALGDAAYSIALGFWVLYITGSTALMGLLMATATIPGVIISPFAGVIVDKYNRKKLLIYMDFIRGILIICIAITAFTGFISIWMVFVAGIILSICGAFFRPCVNSAIPDIVSISKITNANSLFSVASTGANMIGSIIGGFVLQVIGAPVMFFFNGVSYLFSGGSILLVNVPKVKIKTEQHIFKDLKIGLLYVWRFKGLRYILFIAAVSNFFSYIGIILMLPMFQQTVKLGPGKYGIAMACFTAGVMSGFFLCSIKSIPSEKKLNVFIFSNIISNISFIIAIRQELFGIMAIFLIIGGFFNSILNVLLLSTIQITTPQEMRGKVLALMSMMTQGLTPISMALGGAIGEIFPIRNVMEISFLIVLLVITPFMFNKNFKRFLNFDAEKGSLIDKNILFKGDGKVGRSKIKCVVWDLDNTIWDGIISEDKEVFIKGNVIEVIKTLDKRGILQSICSKNDFNVAMDKLKEFKIDEYFIYPQVSWNPKSEGITNIAKSINIGIDSLAFVDDQNFELDEVKFSIPDILIINAREIDALLDMPEMIPRFITNDSKNRRLLYMNDIKRNKIEEEFLGTKESFLSSLEMKLTLGSLEKEDLKRAEELTVRTHQLNATGYTYSYEELEEMSKSKDYKTLIAQLDDKYGSYGKIGLVIIEVKKDTWILKLLLMSCRVVSRGVGTVILNYINGIAKKNSVRFLAEFVPTDRNRIMYITYKFNGFKEISSENDKVILEADYDRINQIPDYIEIIES